MIVREVHALCGTLMILTAALLTTFAAGGWGVVGLFVLLNSYDPRERRTGRH